VTALRQDLVERVLGLPVAAALGFTFDELADGRAVARLRWRPEHSHAPGAFQANPIAALADFAGASAAMSLLPPEASAATVDYTAKFLAEARGEELVARARVLRPGTTLTVSAVDVFVVADGAETLCASALVTVRNVAPRA
jgi:uncharacterized protein (TIGR00369 family)